MQAITLSIAILIGIAPPGQTNADMDRAVAVVITASHARISSRPLKTGDLVMPGQRLYVGATGYAHLLAKNTGHVALREFQSWPSRNVEAPKTGVLHKFVAPFSTFFRHVRRVNDAGARGTELPGSLMSIASEDIVAAGVHRTRVAFAVRSGQEESVRVRFGDSGPWQRLDSTKDIGTLGEHHIVITTLTAPAKQPMATFGLNTGDGVPPSFSVFLEQEALEKSELVKALEALDLRDPDNALASALIIDMARPTKGDSSLLPVRALEGYVNSYLHSKSAEVKEEARTGLYAFLDDRSCPLSWYVRPLKS